MNRLLIFIGFHLMFGLRAEGQLPTLTVWPGDATNNGVVNNVDFLQLGLGYNFFGPERHNANSQWLPQPAVAWAYQSASGKNFAYADCNGDGIVSYNYDAFPIYVHYGNARGGAAPDVFAVGMAGVDAPLAFERNAAQDSLQKGAQLSIPITLGTAALPVDELYGVAFSIFYEPQFVDLKQVNLSEISWANPDNDRITAVYPAANGQTDVAWVRTDHNQRNGHGRIGKADFIIIDDVVGQLSSFKIRIGNIKMIDKFGNETAVAGDTLTITVLPEALSNEDDKYPEPPLRVAPNPADDAVMLRATSDIERVLVFSALGQQMGETRPGKSACALPLNDFPPGTYFLQVQTRAGVFIEKIQVR